MELGRTRFSVSARRNQCCTVSASLSLAPALSVRPVCARRPRCRAPAGSAHWRHRPAPAARALRRQPPDRRQQREGGDHPVALGGHQRHPRVHQFLLRVEHVERRALADARFLAHAVERDLGRLHLRLRRLDIGFRRLELAPRLHHVLPHLIARRCRDRAAAGPASPSPAGSANIPPRPDRSAPSAGRSPRR